MTKRKPSSALATATKLGELSLAAPQVVARRMTRVALNGPNYSSRDRAEFAGMVQEKQLAFSQSWMAMWLEAIKVQQRFWDAWVRSLMVMPGWGQPMTHRRAAQMMQAGALQIAGKGLGPIHAKAMANARRLAR